jgi:hypothetical protein
MKYLSQFGRFWYDFIVGDDWTIAVAVVVLLAVTSAIAHTGRVAWPILPAGVAAILGVSAWRARRAHELASQATGQTASGATETGPS